MRVIQQSSAADLASYVTRPTAVIHIQITCSFCFTFPF
ncbi:Uncharacterised protein [Burkholderia oklahomensis]|nr:hypothetical protein BG90_4132 [Burkholderia oklahomensis C6786]SUY28158.1 Uncharacterised protein [Burkholderia oklahomensis]